MGLPDKAIQESRERVRSALRNSGFRGPLVRVVVNLAPADLRKEGPAFDLPIALGLLAASGQLDRPQLDGLWCAGELGLDGQLRPIRGTLAIAACADSHGATALVVPDANAAEAALIRGLPIRAVASLAELVDQLKQGKQWSSAPAQATLPQAIPDQRSEPQQGEPVAPQGLSLIHI